MSNIHKICVVGSGPVSLFIGWSLMHNTNNIVEIVSDRLLLCSNKYQLYIDNTYLASSFTPIVLPSSSLANPHHDLYILCCTPPRSLEIADSLQLQDSDLPVLIVSSYSAAIFESLSNHPSRRFYAWPLVSVEFDDLCITSTNFLHLSLYQQNLNSNIINLLSNTCIAPNSFSFTSNPKIFQARSLLTFALYSFMLDIESFSSLEDCPSFTKDCTSIVLSIASKSDLSVDDFPGFSPSESLISQLNNLFSQLIQSCFASPASRHNLNYLFSNKDKLIRYISAYEHDR